PLRFGKWRDRHEFEGHPEAAAMAFGQAKQKVRADADLPCDKDGDRVVLRHQELAAMLWPEEPGESEEPDSGGTERHAWQAPAARDRTPTDGSLPQTVAHHLRRAKAAP